MDEKIEEKKKMPTCLLVMGMAGSGKTTFVQRLTAQLHMNDPQRPPYVVNLDPAVAELQFPVIKHIFSLSKISGHNNSGYNKRGIIC